MLALVDESISPFGVGTYVIGCVVLPHAERGLIRAGLDGRAPFHFNSASHASRVGMLKQIGEWRLAAVGYVYRGLYPIGREGARQACLRRLLADLRDWDVNELLIETRRDRENTFDAVTILNARQFNRAPPNLSFGWGTKKEPLLRLPDAVAGAVRASSAYDRTLASIHAKVRRLT